MFGSTMEYTTRNDKGEYEVARGISANVFKCILVSHLFINNQGLCITVVKMNRVYLKVMAFA